MFPEPLPFGVTINTATNRYVKSGRGTEVAALALLVNQPRLFSLKAVSDVTCLIVNREKFVSTMNQFPEVLPKVVKALTERIINWEERFLDYRNLGCEACSRHVGISVI